MQPSLRLFGAPQIHFEGEWRLLPTNQLTLLAAYLAFSEGWVSREELITRFWPDAPKAKARRNLNQLAYQLKKEPWASKLESNATHLRLDFSTDLKLFREAIADSDWAEASSLYKPNFLAGSFRGVSANFEAWLASERDALAQTWRDASFRHASALEAEGQHSSMLELLERVLQQDNLSEDVVQIYMSAALKAGQPKQGLRVFESFESILSAELDMAPLEETLALAKRLRRELVTQPVTAILDIATPDLRTEQDKLAHNLPAQLTPFVGRKELLETIRDLLHDSSVRLITLLGPGGMGKTRLAIQTVLEHIDVFEAGAVFVPLADVTNHEAILPRVLNALGAQLKPHEVALAELVKRLKDRQVLLVLDNLEQIESAALVVLKLLNLTNIKLLVTSRHALELRGEHLVLVEGLELPLKADFRAESDSVQLFLRVARRVKSSFTLDDRNTSQVAHLCQILGGSPLGIELAANWLRLLSLTDIEAELAAGLDLLETTQRNVPKRHRSLRAVFEQSWQRLSKPEQKLLKELSVFEGGFNRQGAMRISNAPLRLLLSLLNKSWLQQNQQGRFEQHMLLKDFCSEKLKADGALHESTKNVHLAYVLELAELSEKQLRSPEQVMWLKRFNQEHSNIQAALAWSERFNPKAYVLLAASLAHYWWTSGRFQEGHAYLQKALGLVDSSDEAGLAKAYYALGFFAWLSGDADGFRSYCEKSLGFCRSVKDRHGEAKAHDGLGIAFYELGDLETSVGHLKKSLAIIAELGDRTLATIVRSNLATITGFMGDFETARAMQEENLKEARAVGDQFGEAIILNVLGRLNFELGEHQAVSSLLAKSITIKIQFEDRWGSAFSFEYVAALLEQQGHAQVAAQLFGAAEALREELSSPIPKNELSAYERDIARLKTALDEKSLQLAWAKGRTLSWQEALELCLRWLN